MSAFKIARGVAKVAIAASCLAIIAASRLFMAAGGGLDNAPAKRKNPDAGKRKAAKRARKAAKNLEMYKTVGDRPWLHSFIASTADSLRHRLHASDYSEDDDDCDELRANVRSRHMFRMKSLREHSGFKQMSAIAGYFQTHDVTDVLNCGHCGGRGTWKDDEKGPTMCLRCKGKGRVIFCKPQWIKYVPSADRYEREMRLREQVAGLYMEEAERPE